MQISENRIASGTGRPVKQISITEESGVIRWLLTAVALSFLGLFIVVPVMAVFTQAFEKGTGVYLRAITDPNTVASIRLSLLTMAVAVLCNLFFGVAAAWAIAKFNFRGKGILITLIDLPFAVSPVISGLIFVLLFGTYGLLGPMIAKSGIKIIFAVPGIVLATIFVTFPFVARELIPLMQAQGPEQEEAATVLGADGWQTFFRVTLPNIKWGLIYGVILCSARSIGEFGAVSVVSGHIRGITNTVPLHTEILYNEYDFVGAFSVASLLIMVAVATIGVKALVEWKFSKAGNHAAPERRGTL